MNQLTDTDTFFIALTSYLVISMIFSGVVAYVASSKGRNGFSWFLGSFFFSPLLAFLLLVALGLPPEERAKRVEEEERIRARARQKLKAT